MKRFKELGKGKGKASRLDDNILRKCVQFIPGYRTYGLQEQERRQSGREASNWFLISMIMMVVITIITYFLNVLVLVTPDVYLENIPYMKGSSPWLFRWSTKVTGLHLFCDVFAKDASYIGMFSLWLFMITACFIVQMMQRKVFYVHRYVVACTTLISPVLVPACGLMYYLMKDRINKHSITFDSYFESLWNFDFFSHVEAEFIAGIDQIEVDMHMDALTEQEAENVIFRLEGDKKYLIWILIAAIGGIGLQLFGLFFGSAAIISYLFMAGSEKIISRKNIVDLAASHDKLLINDGIYHIRRVFLGFGEFVGVGIVWKGVMHTRLHVSGNSNLHIMNKNGTPPFILSPAYVNEEADLISWGGIPVMRDAEHREMIYAMLVGHSGKTVVVKSFYSQCSGGIGMFRSLRTRPGMSGSPVFARSTNAEGSSGVDLVGLLGVNIKLGYMSENEQIELSVNYGINATSSFVVGSGQNMQLFAPPGSGKSHVFLPQVVMDCVRMNKKCVISAPTRLICVQIFERLRLNGVDPGIMSGEWQGSGSARNPGALVRITPHAVLCSDLYLKGLEYLDARITRSGRVNGTVYVIDEAHFDDPKTIALLWFLRSKICFPEGERTSHQLIEMTATGVELKTGVEVVQTSGADRIAEMNEGLDTALKRVLTKDYVGKKIIIFCAAALGRDSIDAIAKKIRLMVKDVGVEFVRFHRASMERAFADALAPASPDKVKIVCTTNMAEVGFNLPDAIEVIDVQQQAVWKLRQEGSTYSARRTHERITLAQKVQRAGRVGRGTLDGDSFHKGVYSSPGGYCEGIYHQNSANILEALMVLKAWDIRPNKMVCAGIDYEDIWNVINSKNFHPVTKQQIEKWFSNREYAEYIASAIVFYDPEGNLRTRTMVKNYLNVKATSRICWRYRNKEIYLPILDDRILLRIARFVDELYYVDEENPQQQALEEQADHVNEPYMYVAFERGQRQVMLSGLNWKNLFTPGVSENVVRPWQGVEAVPGMEEMPIDNG